MSAINIQGESGKRLGATVRELGSTGGYGLRLSLQDLATDTATWSVKIADWTAALAIPEEGERVKIFHGSTKVFDGICTLCRTDDFTAKVTISGPDWWLEQEPLTSSQTDSFGTTVDRPTYALPAQSLTTSLQALLNRAIARGLPFQLGTLASTFNAPQITLKQMTFGQAVADLLRLTPDVVSSWNYAAATPTFNTTRRASASVTTLDARQLKSCAVEHEFELRTDHVAVAYVSRGTNGLPAYQVAESGDAGAATAGGGSTITLRVGASNNNASYVGAEITILSGTGAGQTRRISAYNGNTRVATVTPAWSTAPASGSNYKIGGGAAAVGRRQVAVISGIELDTYLPKDYYDTFTLTTGATTTSGMLTFAIARYSEFTALAKKYNYTATNWPMTVETGAQITCYNGYNTSGQGTSPFYISTTAPAVYKTDGTVAVLTGKTLVVGDKPPEWATQYAVEEVKVKLNLYYMFQEVSYIAGTGNVNNTLPAWAEEISWDGTRPAGAVLLNISGSTVRISLRTMYRKAIEVQGFLINSAVVTAATVYRPADYSFVNPPAGFAAGVQESHGWEVYSGEVSFDTDRASLFSHAPGSVVNLTNHRAEFSTMRAPLRGVIIDVDSGHVTYQLGAPPRFSYRAFIDRIRSRGSDNVIYI